jgi:hypothetical protein
MRITKKMMMISSAPPAKPLAKAGVWSREETLNFGLSSFFELSIIIATNFSDGHRLEIRFANSYTR